MGLKSGCVEGREANLVADLSRTFLKSRSIRRRLVWDSKTSPVVVLREPVINLVAWHWTADSFFSKATEPNRLRPEGEGCISVNQTSAAYVNVGIATVV
jgi:hypothetical protein